MIGADSLAGRGLLQLLALALVSSVVLGPAVARAQQDACNDAYVETQRLQRELKLRRARQLALRCGQDDCTTTVRTDCARWLEGIDRAMPSLLVIVRDDRGEELRDVRIEVDGELVVERLDGRALDIDPGEHVLRFLAGDRSTERHILVREAEKYRELQVRFDAPGGAAPTQPPPTKDRASVDAGPESARPRSSSDATPNTTARSAAPVAAYVLGGLGLVGLATFATAAISGYVAEMDLRDRCSSDCDRSELETIRTRYLVGDVALGIGLVSLAGAGLVWWTRSADSRAAAAIRAAPTAGGFVIVGAF